MEKDTSSGNRDAESVESESDGTSGERSGSLRDAWRSGTPEDVKAETKKLVEKGVAALAGAIKGFADRSEQDRLPDKARRAVRQAGEATTAVAGEAESQMSRVGEEAKRLGETAKSQAQSLREQARSVKDDIRGSGTGTAGAGSAYSTMGDDPPDLGPRAASSGLGMTGLESESFGMGGSGMEPTPGAGSTEAGPTDEGLRAAKGLPAPGKEKDA